MGNYFSYESTMAGTAQVIAQLITSPSERLVQVMNEVGKTRVQIELANAEMMMRAAENEAAGRMHAADTAVAVSQKEKDLAFERERLESTNKNAADKLAIDQGELDLKKKTFDALHGPISALGQPGARPWEMPANESFDKIVQGVKAVGSALDLGAVLNGVELARRASVALLSPAFLPAAVSSVGAFGSILQGAAYGKPK